MDFWVLKVFYGFVFELFGLVWIFRCFGFGLLLKVEEIMLWGGKDEILL